MGKNYFNLDHTKGNYPYSAGIDLDRQNLTSVEVRI